MTLTSIVDACFPGIQHTACTFSMMNKWCRHSGTPHEQRALFPTSTVNLRSDSSPRTFPIVRPTAGTTHRSDRSLERRQERRGSRAIAEWDAFARKERRSDQLAPVNGPFRYQTQRLERLFVVHVRHGVVSPVHASSATQGLIFFVPASPTPALSRLLKKQYLSTTVHLFTWFRIRHRYDCFPSSCRRAVRPGDLSLYVARSAEGLEYKCAKGQSLASRRDSSSLPVFQYICTVTLEATIETAWTWIRYYGNGRNHAFLRSLHIYFGMGVSHVGSKTLRR